MGIMTDNLQMINRTFVSEKAEKQSKRKQKENLQNALYKYFYDKFYDNINYHPDNTYSYFMQPKKKMTILKDFQEINLNDKSKIYNSILKSIYNDFKANYKMNISTENIQKEEEKRKQELLKIIEKQEKELSKVNSQIEKYNIKYQKELEKRNKTHINGANKILAGLFIGGKVASKTWKNNFYKGLK